MTADNGMLPQAEEVVVWLRPAVMQGDYVAAWRLCNPEESGAVRFVRAQEQQGGES